MGLLHKIDGISSNINWRLTGALMSIPVISGSVHQLVDRTDHSFEFGTFLEIGIEALVLGVTGVLISYYNKKREDTERSVEMIEKRHKTLFETSIDAIMTLEPPEWRFTKGNPATVKMFKTKDEEEFASLGPWELSPEYQPDGRPSSEKAKEMILKAMEEGSNFFEWTHKRYNGEEFPATVLLSRITEDKGAYLQATVRDITEQKKANEKLEHERYFSRLLLDSIPHPAMIINKKRRIITANKSAQDIGALIGGYCWRDFAQGLSVIGEEKTQIVRGDESTYKGVKCYFCLADEALDDSEEKRDSEVKIGDSIFDTFWVPLGDGNLFLHYAIDMTDQRRTQEKLIEAEKMDSIGNLAGGVAHDFNNMLGGILGYASVLLMDETDPEKKTGLKGIVNSAQRAAELTQKLLAFGRKGKNLVQAIDLNDSVDEVYGLLERSVDKSIMLRTEFEKRIYSIDADSSQINQVIMNLCVNASEAMPQGGVLTVQTRNMTLDDTFCEIDPALIPGEYAQLTVTDTGEGMTKEVKNRIFEPFFTTKTDGDIKGTGLGLATVYGIIKNHHGVIDIDSEIGEGTTFTVYFPKGEKEQQIEVVVGTGSKNGSGTILLVDDEEIIRKMSKRLMERLGYKVITANDGIEGVKVYQQRHSEIDGVILDMKMPNMGGKEAFIEMQKIDPSVRALLSTGYGNNAQAQEILDLGVRSLLSKPYDVDEIADSLKQLLE